MKKIKKNKKLINQNKRNFLANNYYKNKIKKIIKFTKTLIKKKINDESTKNHLINTFYSIMDKATIKNVIHKNTAARKKQKFKINFNKIILN
jgi:small subunit ribosomal protein S20